jgi:hypothetical protein
MFPSMASGVPCKSGLYKKYLAEAVSTQLTTLMHHYGVQNIEALRMYIWDSSNSQVML